MDWIPRYIKQTSAKRPGQVITAEDWNELFNLVIGQGDYTAEGLLSVITTFTNNLTTKADLVSGKIPLEQIPEIFKPTGLEALITTVDGLVPTVNNLVATVGGIKDYVLPTASTTVKGGIKVDGTSITVDENGVASAGVLTEADVFAIREAGATTLGDQITTISWYMPRAYIPSSVISMGSNWLKAAIATYKINGGEHLTTVGDSFAQSCAALTTISLPALTTVGNSFAYVCTALTTISLPALTTVGNSFVDSCTALKTISLPALTTVGDSFAQSCAALTTISLPALTTVGNSFAQSCAALTTISLPALTTVGNSFAQSCTALKTISLPALTTVGDSFAQSCAALTTISLPALTTVGNSFAYVCTALTTISLPALATVGNSFAYKCPLTHLVVGGANTLTLTSTSNNAYTAWKLPVADMVAFGTALKPAASATSISFSATYWNALSAAQKAIFTNKNYTVTTV